MTTFITADITMLSFTLPHMVFHWRCMNINWKGDSNLQPAGDLVTRTYFSETSPGTTYSISGCCQHSLTQRNTYMNTIM